MTKLQDFTLIIPTYNRAEHLARLLEYLDKCSISFPVVILDSSRAEEAKKNLKAAEACSFSVTIHDYPDDVPLKQKLLNGLSRIDSEFCAFCADDDLVLPDAIEETVAFLRANKDYVTAQGLYFAFTLEGRRCFVDDILYDAPSLDHNTGIERVAALFDDYQSNFYGVYRTAIQRQVFEIIVDQDNSLFFELGQSTIPAAIGKVMRLPIVYAGRQRSPSADNPTRWHPVEWLAADPTEYNLAFSRFKEPIIDMLVENEISASPKFTRYELENILDLIQFRYTAYSIKDQGVQAALYEHLRHGSREDVVNAAFAAAYAPDVVWAMKPGSTAYRIAYGIYKRFLKPFLGKYVRRFVLRQGGAEIQRYVGDFVDLEMNPKAIEKLEKFGSGITHGAAKTIHVAIEKYGR